MGKIKDRIYALDNSGIIHMASMKKNHTNSFRFSATLQELVRPELLQLALDKIVGRFPTIAAGVDSGFLKHRVVPVSQAPKVVEDHECLASMTRREIRQCAFRVLYSEKKISIEVFHSLTDGYGGMTFLNTLLAEYLKLVHQIEVPCESLVLDVEEEPKEEELTDDYFTYAGESSAPLKQRKVYQLPGKVLKEGIIRTTTQTYDIKKLLDAAHRYKVSLNTFLTSVMVKSIVEIQKKHSKSGTCKKPVQIMIPTNLRKKFPSRTLRNFSLFATPCVEASESEHSFEKLVRIIEKQIKEQLDEEKLAEVMARNTKYEKLAVLKLIPLSIKCLVLKSIHHFVGEQTSCITFSNLGRMPMPKVLAQYVKKVDVVLTPRMSSPYNCGMITYGDTCYINFSRLCKEPELETCFRKNLSKLVV